MDQRDVQGMARKPVTNMIDRLDAAYSFTGHFNAPEVQPHSENYHIVRYSGNTESNSLHISARLIVGQVKETSACTGRHSSYNVHMLQSLQSRKASHPVTANVRNYFELTTRLEPSEGVSLVNSCVAK